MADKSLNIIIPKELAHNLDYWFQIRSSINNGYPIIPNGFLNLLCIKYDIDIEVMKSSEKSIVNLVTHLHNNPDIIGSYLFNNTQSVFESSEEEEEEEIDTYSSRGLSKSRRRLCKEIPLAEFEF